MNLEPIRILIGMVEEEKRTEISRRIGLCGFRCDISFCARREDLEFMSMRIAPRVIVLGETLLPPEERLESTIRRLAVLAPVIVLSRPERQGDIAALIPAHDVSVVCCTGDFSGLVAAQVERFLRPPHRRESEFRSAWLDDLTADFPEILRHEINNPLTGILGNAELLLTQLRGKAPAIALQRLETMIDLAVRLRETIRILSVEWERQHSVNSI